MKKKMYIITKEYPIGDAETSFLEPEYQQLRKVYNIVFVAAELKKQEHSVVDGRNVVVKMQANTFLKFVGMIKFFLHKDAWVEIKEILKEKKCVAKHMFRAVMYGTYAEIFFLRLKRKIKLGKDTEAIFYFYWWDYKCFGMTMHKRKYPKIKIIARTHRYDLYDEGEMYGRQYFKPQMDRELERLIFISYHGKQYYLNKYQKKDSIKYPLHCLGVRDPKVDLSIGKDEIFHILSCSYLIPRKRVELIIGALSKISEIQIKWTHIGDGPEKAGLYQLAIQKLEKDNIEYEFLGELQNNEVIGYYKKNNINCFITTTSSEGNPVSVQEALSFGIPVIATKISDIPRMIDGNGILLSENPSESEIADAIRQIAKMDDSQYIELRKNSYKIYCRDYDAERNHEELIKDLAMVL